MRTAGRDCRRSRSCVTALAASCAASLRPTSSDWAALGIGWEAYRALAYLVPERAVIGFPHPTGGYRDFRKMLEKGQLRKEIKDRASRGLCPPEQGAVWLGSEKSGA